MPKGVYKLPNITNEPIKSYAPGSPERAALKEKFQNVEHVKDVLCSRHPDDHRWQRNPDR